MATTQLTMISVLVFRHQQGCNHGSRSFHYPVSSLLRGKWSFLYHNHTFSAFSKPTILYCCSVCKEYSGYHFTMFIANMEGIRGKFANPDITRCLDPHNPTCRPSKHHVIDMSQKGHRNHLNMKTCTYIEATHGQQCHIKLLPTT